jgi:hypothetical protein
VDDGASERGASTALTLAWSLPQGVDDVEVAMIFEDDADTLPGTGDSRELEEAIEWLRQEGYLSGEERPFEKLLRDG